MDERRPAGRGSVPDVRAPGLVVAVPADRGDLEPTIASRRIDLEIKGTSRRGAEIARAEVDDPVVQLEVLKDPFRADRDVGMVGSSRVDLQACKLEYSIVSPK